MKSVGEKILDFLGITSTRSKNITGHVLLSFLYKAGSVLSNLMIVPLALRFLDTENYGVWLTISSLVTWFYFLDIGIGHGFRNKFAESLAKNDTQAAHEYVSTAYFSLAIFASGFLVLSIIGSYLINWNKIFNSTLVSPNEFQLIMLIVFGCFSLQLVLGLITALYTADQRPSIQPKFSFLSALSSLVAIWLFTIYAEASLLSFAIAFSIIPVLVLITFNVFAFRSRYSRYTPDYKLFKTSRFNDIFGLGLSFFVIQLSMVVLNSTDNLIIAHLIGPEEVVPYNIAYKYFSIALIIMTVLFGPYWSAFTEAYVKEDIKWIKNSIRSLLKLVLGIIILIILMTITAETVYQLWIGDLVTIPTLLTVSMSIYFIVSISYSPYNYFLNGLGKIRIHMYTFLLGALLNIPLSIILVNYFSLGAKGVIVATTICVLPNTILFPIQYRKLINNNANGIWNK